MLVTHSLCLWKKNTDFCLIEIRFRFSLIKCTGILSSRKSNQIRPKHEFLFPIILVVPFRVPWSFTQQNNFCPISFNHNLPSQISNKHHKFPISHSRFFDLHIHINLLLSSSTSLNSEKTFIRSLYTLTHSIKINQFLLHTSTYNNVLDQCPTAESIK